MSLALEKCRLCLKPNDQCYSIFEGHGKIMFAQMVMEMTKIKIRLNDGLPNKICITCIMRLRSAYEFKLQCEKVDRVIQQNITQIKNISVSNQSKEKIVTPSRGGFSKTSIHPSVSIQMMPTPVSDTQSSDIRQNKTQANQHSSHNNHIQANDGENGNRYNSKSDSATPKKNIASTSDVKPSTPNVMKSPTPEMFNCSTCKKQFKLFIAFKKHSNKCLILHNTQKKMKSIIKKQLTTESDYICIYCHKQYKNISNLNRHLIRGHSKILHALLFSTRGLAEDSLQTR